MSTAFNGPQSTAFIPKSHHRGMSLVALIPTPQVVLKLSFLFVFTGLGD